MKLEAMAREIAAAQREVRQIAPFTTRYAQFDNHAAYQVARQLHERRIEDGWVATGRKIGFTNPDMWALYGGWPASTIVTARRQLSWPMGAGKFIINVIGLVLCF